MLDKKDLIGLNFPVHNKGFVRVVDMMGDDAAITQAARCSYGAGTKTVNEDRGLIRYLIKHKHTSPLEMCELKLHIKMPIFVARQWVRHRMASLNEYSARYSEVKDEFFVPSPEDVQGQSTTNKQGSQGALPEDTQIHFRDWTEKVSELTYRQYKNDLDHGVAREMARINLPLTSYTEMYWKMDLHNLLHFLRLRCDSHAQKEIREYADVILHEIVAKWVPHTYEAFMDYAMNSVSLSAQEAAIIKQLLAPDNKVALTEMTEWGYLSKREQQEFERKIKA